MRAYTVIGEDLWTAPGTRDSTKPGLKARVWQVDQPGTTSLANRTHRAEQELAGIIGPNVADLTGATAGIFNIDMVNWNQEYAVKLRLRSVASAMAGMEDAGERSGRRARSGPTSAPAEAGNRSEGSQESSDSGSPADAAKSILRGLFGR